MRRVKTLILKRKGKMDFPDLVELIKASGLSVEKFAAKIGVKRQAVYAWARGDQYPTLENMINSCKVLGILERVFLEATGFDTSGLPDYEDWPNTSIELNLNNYSDETDSDESQN